MSKKQTFDSDQLYTASLEGFLNYSHEDQVDIDGILAQMPRHMNLENRSDKNLRILDVGSGNGAKAFYLVEKLQSRGFDVVLDAIEPKEIQRRHLLSKQAQLNLDCLRHVYEQPLEKVEISENYDLILLIHCLYEFPREKDDSIVSLEKLLPLLRVEGVGVIVVEHIEGDFQRLKRHFYPIMRKQTPVSELLVSQTLSKKGIKFEMGEVIEFRFPLEEVLEQNDETVGRSLEFLFSTSLEEDPMLSTEEFRAIGKWIRQQEKNKTLWTPDRPIWFWGEY